MCVNLEELAPLGGVCRKILYVDPPMQLFQLGVVYCSKAVACCLGVSLLSAKVSNDVTNNDLIMYDVIIYGCDITINFL